MSGIRGRPRGTKNSKYDCYNVRYLNMQNLQWITFNASSYENIKNILLDDYGIDVSYNVIQNIALGRKKDKIFEITRIYPTLKNPEL